MRLGLRAIVVVLAVVVVALAALLLLALVHDSDDPSGAGAPAIATSDELSQVAADLGRPVYWLGERRGAEYELTETSTGRVQIRYLTEGAQAGNPRAEFVTVVTYPSEDGAAALRRAARERRGAQLARTDDGAVLLVDPNAPNNAHLAYPGESLQIEVYSPVPGEALRLAARGQVRPVP